MGGGLLAAIVTIQEWRIIANITNVSQDAVVHCVLSNLMNPSPSFTIKERLYLPQLAKKGGDVFSLGPSPLVHIEIPSVTCSTALPLGASPQASSALMSAVLTCTCTYDCRSTKTWGDLAGVPVHSSGVWYLRGGSAGSLKAKSGYNSLCL